jgi:hypothetical protein
MSNPHGVFAEFYTEAVEFKFESEQQGRPVFKELPFIRIQTPGDRNNVLEVKATEYYQKRFPREWSAYKSNSTDAAVIGTVLSQWPQITKSQVKEAEFFGIKTVEQVASLSDSNLQRLGMGWMEIRRKAQAYLDAASGSAETTKLAADNERLRADFEALKAQVTGQAEEPKPRGRPRKETANDDPAPTGADGS